MTARRLLLTLVTGIVCWGMVNDRNIQSIGLAQSPTPAATNSKVKAPNLNCC